MEPLQLTARAYLIEDDGRLKAWAEKHVRQDRDISWLLMNYCQSTEANSNGHIFSLQDLRTAKDTLLNKPLNMLHQNKYVVGSYVGAELIIPEGTTETAAAKPAFVEALAAFWKSDFPDEFQLVSKAHKEGTLFTSMECVPETLTCSNCNQTSPFKGRQHESYCDHLRDSPIAPKVLNQPHFSAGAIIIPPVRPGWSGADVTEMAELVLEQEKEKVLAMAQSDVQSWQTMMDMVVEQAKDYSFPERMKMGKSGLALPDGSFPIKDKGDLASAIKLAGNAKDSAKAKAHIKKRAKALGAEAMIPDSW